MGWPCAIKSAVSAVLLVMTLTGCVVDAVPLRPEGKERYRHYLTLAAPKAFIIYDTGGWRFWSNDRNAMTNALDQCAREGKTCWLYAVDDRVVWQADVDKRVGKSAQLLDR